MELYETDLRAFVSDLSLAGLAPTTIEQYKRFLRRWRAEASHTPTMRGVKDWLATQTPWNAYMAARALRRYVRWYAAEYGTDDWSRGIPCRLPKEWAPQRTATAEDLDRLLAPCDTTWRGLRDEALLRVLATTGIRRSEAVRMTWPDIDWDAGALIIPKTKAGKARMVGLSRTTHRSLRGYRASLDETVSSPSDWVWASRRGNHPLTPNGLAKMIRRRAHLAGVDVTTHSFRRGFAVTWLSEGGSQTHLQTAAGWSSERLHPSRTPGRQESFMRLSRGCIDRDCCTVR